MTIEPLLISLPTEDRVRAHAFYRDGLGLEAVVGPLADDGVPEPLVIVVNAATRLMFIPTGGFGWVLGDRPAAPSGSSECLLGITAQSDAEVDAIVTRAETAGATVTNPPEQKPWGYTGSFADPDGHVWNVTAGADFDG
jgi:predicted lactoylglutathione lyase